MYNPAVNFRDEKGIMVDEIAHNRENFIHLCENFDVDLVITSHTHSSVVFDSNENIYLPLHVLCLTANYIQK